MENLFLICMNAGISGSVIILVGLLLRPIFRKVPRRILCIVWLLAAIRLVLPITIESRFSLQPDYGQLENLVLEQQYQPDSTPPDVLPDIGIPDANPEPSFPPQDIPVVPESPDPILETSLDWMQLLSVVWVAVIAGILTYCVVSYIVLKHQIRSAVPYEDGVLESEHIGGAFLLGYLKPRIYLPIGLSERDRALILAHERSHIRQLDHWWKLVGVLCVAIHWYNPLVWLAYALLCRDIEITCDERVIRSMNPQERKAYSQALLNSEKRRLGILECPVAFGEVDLKQRIRNVLAYHPYGYWLTAFAIALVVFVAFCFLTSPVTEAAQAPTLETPATQPTEPTGTQIPDTTPVSTTPPVTEPLATESTVTEPVATQPPVTNPPATEPPVTQPSVFVIEWGHDSSLRRSFQLTSDGTLTIYGNAWYTSSNESAWKKYADLITKVVITEGCTAIAEESFQNLYNLTEVYLCESLEIIGANAFAGCDQLQYVYIPANVTTIDSCAFYRCMALSKVEFASNSKLQEIGSSAFASTAITGFTAPPNLKTIESYAFNKCWRLKRVVLRGRIQEVKSYAFRNCTQLEYVVLGETLTSAAPIFRDCGEIETVENYSQFPFEDFQ